MNDLRIHSTFLITVSFPQIRRNLDMVSKTISLSGNEVFETSLPTYPKIEQLG